MVKLCDIPPAKRKSKRTTIQYFGKRSFRPALWDHGRDKNCPIKGMGRIHMFFAFYHIYVPKAALSQAVWFPMRFLIFKFQGPHL